MELLQPTKNKLESIQILRGVAACVVVFCHFSEAMLDYGYHSKSFIASSRLYVLGGSGVDVFFIISGFIMYYTQYNKIIDFTISRGTIIKNFIIHRFKRIYPTYWIWTTLLVMLWLFHFALKNHYFSFLQLVFSYALIPSVDNSVLSHPILNQGWTLIYEIYFYVVFALAILFRKNFNIIISVFSLMLLLGVLFNLFVPASGYACLSKNGLLIEFLFGMLAAHFIKNRILHFSNTLYKAFIIIAVIGFGVSLLYINNMDYRSLFWGTPSFLLVLGLVGSEGHKPFKKNILTSVLLFLGNASYSIYLTHGFGSLLLGNVLKKHHFHINDGIIVIVSLVAIMISSFTYYLVEKPINSLLYK